MKFLPFIQKLIFRHTKVYLIGILAFCLGLVTALVPIKSGATFPKLLEFKVKQVFKDNSSKKSFFLSSVKTSRYEFILKNKFPIDGAYQITSMGGEIYAIERFSGELYGWNLENNSIKKYGNIFKGITFGSSGDQNSYPQVTDLHIAFGQFFFSAVLPSKENSCLALHAFKFEILDSVSSPIEIFRTPCIEDLLNPFLFGGRFTNSAENLFLSIGDQRFDRSGFLKNTPVAIKERSNRQSVFGTIVMFKKNYEDYLIYSKGHRNVQGLYYSVDDKVLYASEHGPQGGDEVNIIRQGKDYGWPLVTFGKPYGWAFSSSDPDPNSVPGTNYEEILKQIGHVSGTHVGYEAPIFSWAPSQGVGAVFRVQSSTELKDWKNQLLVVAMARTSIHRLVLDDGKVIFDEEIPINFRVRDFILQQNGALILSLDEGSLVELVVKSDK